MGHQLRVQTDDEFDGELTLGVHPEGSLAFEDGTAVVDDQALAEQLAERYPNIEYVDAAGTTGDSDTEDSEEASLEPAGDDVEVPFDPTELTVDELASRLEDESYSSAQLDALAAAEEAGEDRSTAQDVIVDAREA